MGKKDRMYNPERREWKGRSYKKGAEPVVNLKEAMFTRDAARQILDAINVEAVYEVKVTDQGPQVFISVSEKQYGMATTALPFTIGGATVKIVKRPKK